MPNRDASAASVLRRLVEFRPALLEKEYVRDSPTLRALLDDAERALKPDAATNNNEGRGHALHVQDDGAARVLPVPSRQEEVGTAASRCTCIPPFFEHDCRRLGRCVFQKLGDPAKDEQAAAPLVASTGAEDPRTTPVGSPDSTAATETENDLIDRLAKDGEYDLPTKAERDAAPSTDSMTREEGWWRSILRDIAYGLRCQPELTRLEIADAIDNALKDGVPDD